MAPSQLINASITGRQSRPTLRTAVDISRIRQRITSRPYVVVADVVVAVIYTAAHKTFYRPAHACDEYASRISNRLERLLLSFCSIFSLLTRKFRFLVPVQVRIPVQVGYGSGSRSRTRSRTRSKSRSDPDTTSDPVSDLEPDSDPDVWRFLCNSRASCLFQQSYIIF